MPTIYPFRQEVPMKKIVAMFSVIFSSLFALELPLEKSAENTNQYGYMNFGLGPLPFPVPTLGGGYRIQKDRHGLDLNASFVIVAPERVGMKFSSRYLHYFSSSLERPQWYMGIGPQISPIFKYDGMRWAGLGVSPEFLLGREHFSNKGGKRFWEIVVDFPTFASNIDDIYKWGTSGNVLYFPYIFVQYGWGF